MDVHPNSVFALNNELKKKISWIFFSTNQKENKMNTSFHLHSNVCVCVCVYC
jgi:hypothetical protein